MVDDKLLKINYNTFIDMRLPGYRTGFPLPGYTIRRLTMHWKLLPAWQKD
jgi:hypothetical protein